MILNVLSDVIFVFIIVFFVSLMLRKALIVLYYYYFDGAGITAIYFLSNFLLMFLVIVFILLDFLGITFFAYQNLVIPFVLVIVHLTFLRNQLHVRCFYYPTVSTTFQKKLKNTIISLSFYFACFTFVFIYFQNIENINFLKDMNFTSYSIVSNVARSLVSLFYIDFSLLFVFFIVSLFWHQYQILKFDQLEKRPKHVQRINIWGFIALGCSFLTSIISSLHIWNLSVICSFLSFVMFICYYWFYISAEYFNFLNKCTVSSYSYTKYFEILKVLSKIYVSDWGNKEDKLYETLLKACKKDNYLLQRILCIKAVFNRKKRHLIEKILIDIKIHPLEP